MTNATHMSETNRGKLDLPQTASDPLEQALAELGDDELDATEDTEDPQDTDTHLSEPQTAPKETTALTTQLEQLDLAFECSDVGNKDRFVFQHQDKLRYVREAKRWVTWDGTRWRPGSEADVQRMAEETTASIFDEASMCTTKAGRAILDDWAQKSRTGHRTREITTMASKDPAMTISQAEFDREPLMLNCENGMVDLTTGRLCDRTPETMVEKIAPVAFDPKAECPTFKRFLDDVFLGDQELIDWVQRALGYSLTGKTTEQVLFLAYGTGANGKTTLFETIREILGDYSRTSEFETFLAGDKSNARTLEAVARLQGRRFALASETDSTKRFSEAIVKKVTGGDTLIGSFLYGGSFEFEPEFKLWLLANHLPIAKDGSEGFWRRMKVVPFPRRFSGQDKDPQLMEKLKAEKEGILAWCVDGAAQWWQRLRTSGSTGLGRCKAVDEATAEYREDNDSFRRFISDCLQETEGAKVSASELYEAYCDWCERQGEETPCSQAIFASRLKERGIQKTRRSSGYVYLNVSLTTETDSPSEFDF